ncbi:MAG: UDP-N-acetylmuramate dehydrogenase [candidate division WOR-3 bacterium]
MELKTEGKILMNEPLSSHTSLHLGGKAKYFLFAETTNDIAKAISFAEKKEIPFFIIGKGTNLLFLDEGFSGIVISTLNLERITVIPPKLIAEAGASLSKVINTAKENSLSGIESLWGIPGSIGGAVVMNAGAFGCEIGNFVSSIKVLRKNKEEKIKEIQFGYRSSNLKGEVVLEVELILKEEEKEKIEEKIKEVIKLRKEKQPFIPEGIGTCGSVFKNPLGLSAGELIEKAGLKGTKIGRVRISNDHCNYFLVEPGASSSDFLELVRFVKEKVKNLFKIDLELEVIIIGKEKEIKI